MPRLSWDVGDNEVFLNVARFRLEDYTRNIATCYLLVWHEMERNRRSASFKKPFLFRSAGKVMFLKLGVATCGSQMRLCLSHVIL